MATVIKICFSLGIFKSSRTLFLLVSPLFLFVTSFCKPFLEAFTCLHWNSLANVLKLPTMLNKTKKSNFLWHHLFVCTLTNRLWVHGQWPITARIIFTHLCSWNYPKVIMHYILIMVIINRCVMSSSMLLLIIMLFCFQRKAHEALLENVPMLKEITVRCLFCCFP